MKECALLDINLPNLVPLLKFELDPLPDKKDFLTLLLLLLLVLTWMILCILLIIVRIHLDFLAPIAVHVLAHVSFPRLMIPGTTLLLNILRQLTLKNFP